MSKLQEIPHVETCPRFFSSNPSYKDKVLFFSLRPNRVSQKNTRKQRLLILRKTATQIKTCRFKILFRDCFFSPENNQSRNLIVVTFVIRKLIFFYNSGSPGRIIFDFKIDNLLGTLREKRFFRILS